MNGPLLKKFYPVERIASASAFRRFLYHPAKYVHAILFREFIYRFSKKEKIISTKLFYGDPMTIALPAATDIYLTGGRSHDSEIRLTRFLLQHLKPGDRFLDIGAHYGFYTLLAAKLVGDNGRVLSFEPAHRSFALLNHNTKDIPFVHAFQQVVSSAPGESRFYEFPNRYAEYNAADIDPFRNEKWFAGSKPKEVRIPSTSVDAIVETQGFVPGIIKIDVEGGEYDVIRGALSFLREQHPVIIMEYLGSKRDNKNHKAAADLLVKLGYSAHAINASGNTEQLIDIDNHLIRSGSLSDNIAFLK